jgi:hypothetical protein
LPVPELEARFRRAAANGFDVWQEPFVQLRLPKPFNLQSVPFERADKERFGYQQWRAERLFVLVPAQAFVANWLSSFKDFPPRQKPASFSVDQIMDKLQSGARD